MKSLPAGSLLRNRDYMVLITAQTVSGIATSLGMFVLPLITLAVTGSAAKAGLIGAAGGLASWLLTLPAGAWADRWNRKWTMVGAEGLSLLTYASLAIAGLMDRLTLPHLVVAAFALSSAGAFFEPAQNAAIPKVVQTRQLAQAMANDQARGALAGIVGSPLGGALMGIAKVVPFLTATVGLVVSWLMLLVLRTPLAAPPREKDTHVVADIVEGLRFIWDQAFLRATVPIATLVNLGANGLLLVVNLHLFSVGVSPAAIGLIDTVSGICAIAGSMAAGAVLRKVRLGTIAMVVLWAFAIVCVPMPLTNNVFVIGGLLGLAMLVNPIVNAGLMAYKTAITPDRLQGRSTSALMFLVMLAVPIAPALGGYLLAHVSHYMAMYTFVVLIVLAAVIASFSPAVRSVPDSSEWESMDPDRQAEPIETA